MRSSIILIADDDQSNLRAATAIVKSQGYNALKAHTAADCLRLAEDSLPNLVLVKNPIEGKTAIQICRNIRKTLTLKYTGLFILTAKPLTEKQREKFSALGVDGYLPYPVKDTDFLSGIESILRIQERVKNVIIENEEKYRLLFTNADEGILIMDMKGIVTDVNPRLTEITGFSQDEILGKNVPGLGKIFKVNSKQIIQNFRSFLSEKIEKTDWQISTKTGDKIDVIVYPSFIIKGGKKIGISIIVSDVTEQKKAERAIARSSAEWAFTFNALTEGISLLDKTGRVVRCNQAVQDITGKNSEELIGLDCTDLLGADNSLKEFCPFDRAKKTLRRESIECRAGGRWVKVTVDPILDDRRAAIGFVHVISDITERKLADDALRNNEDRLSKIMLAANDGMWDWDLRTNEVYFDSRYFEMAGYEKNAFPHRLDEFRKRVHPDDVDYVMEQAQLHLQGKTNRFNVEFRFLTATGEWLWINGKGIIVERDDQGTPLRFVGTHRDIEERKKAEANYESLIQHSNDAIYLLYNRKFEIVNKKFEEMFGVTLEDANKPGFDFINMVKESDRAIIEKRIQDVARGIDVPPRYQFAAIKSDGKEIIVEASVSYIPYKDGTATQGVIRDITERIRAEEKIRQSLEEKEILLKEVHHRVKNNLNVINSLLNLQAGKIETKQQALDAFKESRDRVYAMAMVHEKLYQSDVYSSIDMKDYTKLLANSLLRIYNPSGQVEYQFNIDNFHIDMNRAIPCGLILNELITNALKHAFNGRKKGHLKISFRKLQNQNYELKVEDNGSGLPEDLKERRKASLGMHLVEILTDQLDGKLTINSRNGTEFKLTFPVESNNL